MVRVREMVAGPERGGHLAGAALDRGTGSWWGTDVHLRFYGDGAHGGRQCSPEWMLRNGMLCK
jgi:hypothetical protein